MDSSIMKFLEEDEDETMHSGADVEAFTAALNRDIEEAVSHGSGSTSSQFQPPWQPTSNNENTVQNQLESVGIQREQHSFEGGLKQPESGSDNQQQEDNSSQGQVPPPQHEQPPPKEICQDIPQIHPAMGSQCHQTTPMDIAKPGGKGPAIGMNNQHAFSSVMKNQQVIAQEVGNHPHMETPISSQHLVGSGVNSRRLVRLSMLQHSPTSGMINQQSMAIGTNNQQPVSMGISTQQPMAIAMGLNNQQSVDIRTNKRKSVAMGSSNQQSLGVGIKNQQSNPQAFNSGLSGQQAMSMGVANQQANLLNHGKQVPFALLLPIIEPLLDGDRSEQLKTLYQALKNNEIRKDAFVRDMRNIVGDQMLKMAMVRLHQQAARDAAARQHMPGPSKVQVPAESSDSTLDNNGLQPYEDGRQGDSHNMQATQMSSSYFSASMQEREHPTYPVQGLNKRQQQHLHFSQPTFPKFGSIGKNHPPFQTSNVTTSAASLKQSHDSQRRQIPVHHNNAVQWRTGNSKEQKNLVPLSTGDQTNNQQQRFYLSASHGLSSVPIVHAERENIDRGNPKNDGFEMQSYKLGFSASTSQMDRNLLVPSVPSPIAAANSSKTPTKNPLVGENKPLEALGSSLPPSSKKQKVSGCALLDQSIEQLNDVTAVSGVNLREEEEQLFSGLKEDTQVSEASRRVVQEEEDRLILQKIPLQKKLAEIMAKSGLMSIGSDVEKCLSLCVEERMRGLMSSLIRLSKQRVDIEKPRHRTFITTDVRRKIVGINQKVRVEWEKKQAEEGKLQKLNEPEGSDGEKEKDQSRARPLKVVANKEEDEKMRATAANVAARAAVGGDDMLYKWQLMAEQARQKREGLTDGVTGSQADKDVSRKTLTVGKGARDHQEAEKRSQLSSSPGTVRKLGRNQVIMAQNRVARAMSVKDVIAVLEREPQMSRSTLIYSLYDKIRSESSAG
ncbi:hypothetical protein Leryth_005379 [Lithospermum erythrorhizon]|nr:hypothetical protein Leryth_005379 [Lithospermum erythrorhizon]